MRSFTREIGPEIPGSLFAGQAPGPLIHNYSQGNNPFPQNKHSSEIHTNINQNMNPQTFCPPKSPGYVSGQQGLINYILTAGDSKLSGRGAFLNMWQSWVCPNVDPRSSTFWSDSNQPIMSCQRQVSKSSQSDEDLGDCNMMMIIRLQNLRKCQIDKKLQILQDLLLTVWTIYISMPIFFQMIKSWFCFGCC